MGVGEDLLLEPRRGQRAATAGGLDDLLGLERDRVERLEGGPETVEVPVLGEPLRGLGVDGLISLSEGLRRTLAVEAVA